MPSTIQELARAAFMPSLIIAALVLSSATAIEARDLVRTDIASIYYTQNPPGTIDTFGVYPYDTLAYLSGFQYSDSTGPVCDTVFGIVEIYRLELAEIDWRLVEFLEWRARFFFDSLESSNGRAIVAVEVFPKGNQATGSVDICEAPRLIPYHPSRLNYITGQTIVLRTGWTEVIRPFYQNRLFIFGFQTVPFDSAHFTYLTVLYRLSTLQPAGDLVRVDASYFPDCRWAVWFPDTVYSPYPIDPDSVITVIYPDSGTWSDYTIDLEGLGLPDGQYTTQVMTVKHVSVTELETLELGSRSIFQFHLSFEDCAKQPDYLEIGNEQDRRRIVLGPRFVYCLR
ncbi:hypothetical protein KKH27_00600 [bacterium]|nr:hypothetical protein [bacterium]MBU1984625.1 hypothetical protein [bacterium]